MKIPDDIGIDQTPDLRLALFELSVQRCQRSQVSLQYVAPLQQELR